MGVLEISPTFRLWRAKRASRLSNEPELRLLRILVAGRTFVDIGANRGLYSFAALAAGAKSVIAVEPVPRLAVDLQRRLGDHGVVREGAISSTTGTATLLIPEVSGAARDTRSTLAPMAGNRGKTLTVRTERLDDLDIPRDAVLKIDVEGHEEAVLASGTALLRHRPPVALIVEAEERQVAGSPVRILDSMMEFGYVGWAIGDGVLIPARLFDARVHQSPADAQGISAGGTRPSSFANNLLLVREDVAQRFRAQLESCGFAEWDPY